MTSTGGNGIESYAMDEFDNPPKGPAGVHRGRRSAAARYTPFVVVVVVAALCGFLAWGVLSGEFNKVHWPWSPASSQTSSKTSTTTAKKKAAEKKATEKKQQEEAAKKQQEEEAAKKQQEEEAAKQQQEQAAQVVNKSRPAVANALRLLHLPQPVADLVASGTLSAGHARTVLAFEGSEAQIAMAQAAVERDLSVRELERLAKAAKKAPRTAPPAPKRRDSFYDEVELSLREALGRQVRVSVAPKGGTLQLEFFDPDDLRALANRLAEQPKER